MRSAVMHDLTVAAADHVLWLALALAIVVVI
jgi:hypothetical protein